MLAVPRTAAMLRAMSARLLPALFAVGLVPALVSCKLATAPVRVVGAVAKTTAKAGKKAAVATADAFDKSEEEKAAEKKEKENEDAKAKEAEDKAAPESTEALPPPEPLPQDYLPDLPDAGPDPDSTGIPYQDQR